MATNEKFEYLHACALEYCIAAELQHDGLLQFGADDTKMSVSYEISKAVLATYQLPADGLGDKLIEAYRECWPGGIEAMEKLHRIPSELQKNRAAAAVRESASIPTTAIENAVAWRLLPDGRYLVVHEMAAGGGNLSVGSRDLVYDDAWQYDKGVEAAVEAMNAWDGDGEPDGWYRHPATGRRRPDGDPEKEFVRP